MSKKFYQDHTFVICAYKESPYLETCIRSLQKQTLKSNIIMITSTPNQHIRSLAEKYGILLYINKGEGGIVQDWNFGYSMAKTSYVTIAHQDDVYFKRYTEMAMRYIQKYKKPLIFFSDYYELRGKEYVKKNKLLTVKRIMLLPLRFPPFYSSIFIRRRILSFGSPICCPSVAYTKSNLPEQIFSVGFRSNEDWEAWEKLSRLKGQFIYCKTPLMAHRIHEDSETSAIIADNKRSDEDVIMFSKFWPKPFVKILVKSYAKGQNSNKL